MGDQGSRFTFVRFTASGSEYFRIWAVNLLLTVVTLGFYTPFAKARRLRYFYANTVIDGQPLAFHGNPWTMLRGYLVVLAVLAVNAIASQLWPTAVFVSLPLAILLWPALWRASLLFRLGNTSWRGLRCRFEGGFWQAYAWLPSVLVALVLVAVGIGLLVVALRQAMFSAAMYRFTWRDWLPFAWPVLPMAGAAIAAAHGLWIMKRYQHGGYRLGPEAARLEGTVRPFVRLGLKLMLWSLALQVFAIAVTAFLSPRIEATNLRGHPLLAFSGVLLMLLIVAGCAIASNASTRAWVQNTVWSQTASPRLRFFSGVSAMELGLLSVVNAVGVVLTLGLYRPFAVVSMMKMRLESVRVEFVGDADDWQAVPSAAPVAATGEMAGDFFGFDVGL